MTKLYPCVPLGAVTTAVPASVRGQRGAKIRGMQAAIVAVGSELLGVDRLDTNSLGLTRVLRRYGVALRSKQVLGDSFLEADVEATF